MSAPDNQSPDAIVAGTPADLTDDPRVVEAVRDYEAALEAGQRPNRQELLARHPEIAATLAECLAALDLVHAAVPRLDGSADRIASSPPPAPPAIDPTLPLGDFHIVREIGRGGMGIVYEAVQLSLGRRVALKVLPFAWALDPRQLQRFQNEARAVAHLHHTHIVPIYWVGCERGVHFYAMQYVEGLPLTAVIDGLRQENGPRKSDVVADEETRNAAVRSTLASLTGEGHGRGKEFFRAVARLGAQAADALHYAHEQGVIHRDVKPGNLLVDGHGHLMVCDFGLAQLRGEATLTVTGNLVGTLLYMSPEQALGKRTQVDQRTDVYSLGATLYELLTRSPVFTGRDREELLRQIAFEDPRAPRQLEPAVPADLETIVLKALAKRPEDRYATVQDMAEDLRRFLEHRPIVARRPTALERAAKWARRHPSLVAAAVGVLLLAVVGFAVSAVLVTQEQVKTKAALEAEAQQRERAEKSFRQARQVVDQFAELAADQMAERPELQGVRRKVLEVVLEYYQDFIDQRSDDLSLREELVRSHLRVATLLDAMGSPEDALVAVEKARQLDGRKPAPRPSSPAGRPHGPMTRAGQELGLLSQKSVQDELKLSKEQAQAVAQLTERRRAFRRLHHVRPEEWRAKFEELASQEKALLEKLGPEQARRLRQLALQQRGAEALSEPEIAEALGLTAQQKEKARALQEEAHRAVWMAYGPLGFRPDGWNKTEEAWTAARDKAVALLTAEQRARWHEMVGEPFKGELRPPHREGPGPWHSGREPRRP